jgi:mannose-6-phosphate isomerase-like protein (cupin superfamily)
VTVGGREPYGAPLPGESWQDGAQFHRDAVPVHAGDPEAAPLFKRGVDMAHVAYRPSHPNPGEEGARAGQGASRCVWVWSEQGAQAERISESCLNGMIDTWLDPAASIGWHLHDRTEEIYYLLAGNLTVTVQDRSRHVHVAHLGPGDSHRVGVGMWHGSLAGAEGARFLCVMMSTAVTAATSDDR